MYSVFGLKLGNIAIKKCQECLFFWWGGGSREGRVVVAGEGGEGGRVVGEPGALSLCRGLLCSIFRFVVAILILNHNCG